MQLSKVMSFAVFTLAFGASMANACPNQTPGSTTEKSRAGKAQIVGDLMGQKTSPKHTSTSSDTAS